jgi:hypothetical protein
MFSALRIRPFHDWRSRYSIAIRYHAYGDIQLEVAADPSYSVPQAVQRGDSCYSSTRHLDEGYSVFALRTVRRIRPTRQGDSTMAKDKPQCPVMTTAAGVPMADNRNSLTAGARGPDPLADNQPGWG